MGTGYLFKLTSPFTFPTPHHYIDWSHDESPSNYFFDLGNCFCVLDGQAVPAAQQAL
jgi:hypothetical protein